MFPLISMFQGCRPKSSLPIWAVALVTVAPLALARPVRAQAGRPAPASSFLSVQSEEPTGVYYDRDTLVPQTPVLFSARVQNPSAQARQIELSWKITDANRKSRWERGAKFEVGPNSSILRRELFDPPARGSYLLEVTAVAKQKGPDLTARIALPFAVTIAPPATTVAGARPQSFFILSTPSQLSGNQLDFYSRLGARVLRSPMPADPAKPDWNAVEVQLGERVRRNLASIALLPLGEGQNRRNEAYWARQVPATLARYGGLSLWELSGEVSPADLDAWAQVVKARRPDVNLLGPLPSGIPVLPTGATMHLSALGGATFEWPRALETHPASLRRLWLSRGAAARQAGLTAFHLRRDSEADAALSPGDAAGSLVADYLSAIMAGASSMSEALAPPSNNYERRGRSAQTMARGAAFAMLSRTLEDTSFREQLFAASPSLEGALFRAPSGSIAVLYAPQGQGKMTLQVAPAQALDLFGNQLATSQNGRLELPLSGQPVYVSADVAPDVLSYAFKTAKIEGVAPLAAQVLPLSRVPGLGGPGSAAVRVRLQNIGVGTRVGQIRISAPKGWKFSRDRYDFSLAEGESRTFEFRALESLANPKSATRVPFGIDVSGGTRMSWKFETPVATATFVAAGEMPALDGDLADWSDAVWQSTPPNEAGVSGRVAWKWDASYLYVAAQVKEAALQPRRADESPYEFWRGHDSVQIAFGLGNGPETVPAPAPFRDSDRGFLLSPFNQRGPSQFDGRVLKLWAPEPRVGYNQTVDRVRWGGAVDGAKCVIGRDETAERTTYEARIPLAALPGLNPRALAQKDGGVRFGWLIHNDEGTPLDWGAGVGNFPWWENTATFLPDGALTSPLRATLGFSLSSELARPATPAPTTPAPGGTSATVTPPAVVPPTAPPSTVVLSAPVTTPTPVPALGPRLTPVPATPTPAVPSLPPPPVTNSMPPAATTPVLVAPAPTSAFVPAAAPTLKPTPRPNFPAPTPLNPTGPPTSIPPFIIPPAGAPPRQLPPSAP